MYFDRILGAKLPLLLGGKQTHYSSLAFKISLVVIPTLAAADVAVLLTEYPLNMSVLTPVLS